MVAKSENTLNTTITGRGFDYINGIAFTTVDRDRDVWVSDCASYHGDGGWWFRDCTLVNLNGQKANSLLDPWLQQAYYDGSEWEIISSSEMKMIRVD